jgi:hypothetical protein
MFGVEPRLVAKQSTCRDARGGMSRADPQLLVRSRARSSVDNRRDHDPNVPIPKPTCRPSINPSR